MLCLGACVIFDCMVFSLKLKDQVLFYIDWFSSIPYFFQFVFVFNLIQYKPLEFGDYIYPMWSNGIGWILSLVPIIFITTIAITKILKAPKEMSIMEVNISKQLLHVGIVCRAHIHLIIIGGMLFNFINFFT